MTTLAPLALLVDALRTAITRRYRYTGRHRAVGLSTMAQVDAAREQREALARACAGPTHEMFLPDFDGDVAPYAAKAGAGRFAHLRPEELAAKAAWEQRAAALGVDLAILRVPMPVDDDWIEVTA